MKKTDMKNASNNFIKIIYFDEYSATDYIDIDNGGKKEEIDTHKDEKDANAQVSVKARLEAKLKWFSSLNLSGELGATADYAYLSNKLIKTTILNTVLTDYISLSNNDARIKKFSGYRLSAYPKSLSFIKMYAPYLIMSKDVNEQYDLSKLDEALKNARGYYELIASNPNEKCILRFNINAFRNNYGISDLIKMDLTYHAVEVGEFKEEKLDMANEFKDTQLNSDAMITASDILDDIHEEEYNNILKVYDVILAGIER